MERHRDVSVASNQSPSPDAQSIESSRLQSMARSSRAVSEARVDDGAGYRPGDGGDGARLNGGARRAESEAPQRDQDEPAVMGDVLMTGGGSARSSRAGSEVPDRLKATARPGSATRRVESRPDVGLVPPLTHAAARSYLALEDQCGNDRDGLLNCVVPLKLTELTLEERMEKMRHRLYRTVRHSGAQFRFFQCIHYPLQDDDLAARGAQDAPNAAPTVTPSLPSTMSSSLSKEPSPQPRTSADVVAVTTTTTHLTTGVTLTDDCMPATLSPSPRIEDRLPPNIELNLSFRVDLDLGAGAETTTTVGCGGVNLNDPVPPTISAFALTTLPDPVSGATVLGLCLGDSTGHIEYAEVSTGEASNRRIRKSQSKAQSYGRSTSTSRSNTAPRLSSRRLTCTTMSPTTSLASNTTSNFVQDLRGRAVVRRHSHKAYVQAINALTSAAEMPCVKCLSFVRPHCSPSTISYLTASDHLIKLFHVRREGFSALDVFPQMAHVVDATFRGSRYFARLPPQSTIMPVREFGPLARDIRSLDVSADAETFMSVDDLQVFWWHLEASDTNHTTCIADFSPPSGLMTEVEELVTAACFHPTHGSLFLLTRSSGILNIGDLRDPPSRGKRRYAIGTRITPDLNPTQNPDHDDVLCSISTAAFLGPDHVVTRDYLSLKLWDLRKPDVPCAMAPVMNYIAGYLDALYCNDSIFDRFPVVVDAVSGAVVTGLYDAAVAVWQPLSRNCSADDVLAYYRVDPQLESGVGAPYVAPPHGGRVSVDELSAALRASWLDALPTTPTPVQADSMTEPNPLAAEPGVDKVLNLAIAPGGERFAYTSHNGQVLYVFERDVRHV